MVEDGQVPCKQYAEDLHRRTQRKSGNCFGHPLWRASRTGIGEMKWHDREALESYGGMSRATVLTHSLEQDLLLGSLREHVTFDDLPPLRKVRLVPVRYGGRR